jgi:hypothetical protein
VVPIGANVQNMRGRRQALGQMHGVGKELPRIDGAPSAVGYDGTR